MFLDLIKIDFAFGLLLFLPGYALLIALTRTRNPLGLLGNIVASLVLSIGSVSFILMLIDKLNIKITSASIIVSVLIFSLTNFLFFWFFRKEKSNDSAKKDLVWLIFLLVGILSIFLRMIYLLPKIIPHTTDLGHHMYWVNYIIQFQQLPTYGIPDVIIGEHVIFGAISIISGIGIISALPAAILFIFNMFSLLAIFLLTRELARTMLTENKSNIVGLLSFVSIGIFYAIASPQATYINGGVIGNLMGNLLVPTIFYLFIRAFRKKDPSLTSLGIFLIGTLIYTHHLSTFIFIYSLTGFLLFFGFSFLVAKYWFKRKDLAFNSFWKTFFNIKTVLTSLFLLLFIFLVRIPSYLNSSAIDTAVGAPSKSTRVGLSVNELIHSTGAWRIFYAMIGIVLLEFIFWQLYKKNSTFRRLYSVKFKDSTALIVALSLASAWFITIFIMSHWPAALKVDIISGRIANYLTYPATVLSAFGVYAVLAPAFKRKQSSIAFIVFAIVFIPGIISGLFDVSETYPENTESIRKTTHTFAGSLYLTEKTTSEQGILKDHVYLKADTWIKNFLMRDYKEPLSRTLLKRYNDPIKKRETCTRDMVAIPDSEIGEKCFEETGVKFIILKNNYDTQQFEISDNFSKIFTTGEVVIFQKNHE